MPSALCDQDLANFSWMTAQIGFLECQELAPNLFDEIDPFEILKGFFVLALLFV
jgi:hypothetical protein